MKKTSTGSDLSRSAFTSPSWVAERDALCRFGDRKSRATLAIYHARRSAKRSEFFVHPSIAKRWRLSPADLNWALDALEGKLVETIESKSGQYRMLRILPQSDCSGSPRGAQPHALNALHQTSEEERVEIDYGKTMEKVAAM